MSKSHVPATPANEQEDASLPINNPIRASGSSAVTELYLPGIFHFSGAEPQEVVTDEDDLVDASELIERLMRGMSHRLHELERVDTGNLAPVLAEMLAPLVAELISMHAALKVGMTVAEWTANFLRTAEISCAFGEIHEVACDYLDSVGVAWTDNLDDGPAW